MSQRVTLRDIAREAGLSVAAVSKALNGYANVSETTRRRVREISDRRGYTPLPARNRNVRRREQTRVRRVGLVLPRAPIESRSLDRIACAMTSVAGEFNARVELAELPRAQAGATGERVIAQQAPDVDALVFYGYVNAELAELIHRIELPSIVFGDVEPMQRRPRYQISVDALGMGQYATRALLDAGHQCIGFVGAAGLEGGWADQWRTGYKLALIQRDRALDPAVIGAFDATNGHRVGTAAAEHMANRPEPPSAYVVTDLSPAASFRQAMAARGIALGPTNLIVGGRLEHAAEHGLADLTVLGVDLEDAARHALHLLCRVVRGETVPPIHLRVPFTVHEPEPG